MQTSWIAVGILLAPLLTAEPNKREAPSPAEQKSLAQIREYLRLKVAERSAADPCLVSSRDEWEKKRAQLREELFDMLGLNPRPARGDLKAVDAGNVEREGIVVEKLHFQSIPGLYVTANFYRPAKVEKPLPTILYLNGHARVQKGDVSFGNKTAYQHHGTWFAKNGYCCLTIDTLQLGEIEGIHHGTRNFGMWWWIARGYTPAGVEAWNSIRALDYLQTRKECDMARVGVTGRSGGGAYTWWVAALDDRPACIVPVAGITDLEDHVVDDCIEGHCDCMFMVNRKGWDFATLACLAAPRPCLLSNTDKDKIFPLGGVERIHWRMRKIYDLYGASAKLGLLITEGPHADSQELQIPAFRWMNRWLKNSTDPIEAKGEKPFSMEELRVFNKIPKDQKNTTIQETFVPAASPIDPPKSLDEWNKARERLLVELQRRCFAAWPTSPPPLDVKTLRDETKSGVRRRTLEFTSEMNLRFTIDLVESSGTSAEARCVVHVLNEQGLSDVDASVAPPVGEAWAFVAPRCSGPRRLPRDAKTQANYPRRFVLVGATIDEGRVWDVRRAISALASDVVVDRPLVLTGKDDGAAIALYAALFEPKVAELRLDGLPSSHQKGPIFIDVLQVLDVPQALALALPRAIRLSNVDEKDWRWPRSAAAVFAAPQPLITISTKAD